LALAFLAAVFLLHPGPSVLAEGAPAACIPGETELLHWVPGTAVVVDAGCAGLPRSRSGPLRYAWRVVARPPGSAADAGSFGTPEGAGAGVTLFHPDAAGDYRLAVEIRDDLGVLRRAEGRLRVLAVPRGRPRIWLTPERLALLRSRGRRTPQWRRLVRYLEENDDLVSLALAWQAGQRPGHGRRALEAFRRRLAAGPVKSSSALLELALGYDWLHDRLTPEEREQALSLMAAAYRRLRRQHLPDTWGNHGVRIMLAVGAAGMAALDDTPAAKEWLDHARYVRWEGDIGEGLRLLGEGGGWPEGTAYGFIVAENLALYAAAVRSATGEDLFLSVPWFRDRMAYSLLIFRPAPAQIHGRWYHPYPSLGDSERRRYTLTAYERHAALILADRFRDDPLARQLRGFLQRSPCDRAPHPFRYWADFLWSAPEAPARPPELLGHLCRGTGLVLLRSSWTEGDAATQITFQCGDRFTYHQHQDQGSFTIWKGGDLAIESGVYEGYASTAAESHIQGYYSRTVAHNTLLVLDPRERFEGYRSGNTVPNDGGQRTWRPGGNSPSAAEWTAHHERYETGEIQRFIDAGPYAYIRADVTPAYNSTAYTTPGNRPKLDSFLRELVYLRPPEDGGPEALVVHDRVGATRPELVPRWLLHTLEAPKIEGEPRIIAWGERECAAGRAVISAPPGTLFLTVLRPASPRLTVIGGRIKGTADRLEGSRLVDEDQRWTPGSLAGNTLGFTHYRWNTRAHRILDNTEDTLIVEGSLDDLPVGIEYSAGKDYWSNGRNYPAEKNDYETDYSAYRLEITAAEPSRETEFLVVLQPSAARRPRSAEAAALPAQGGCALRFADTVILFAHDPQRLSLTLPPEPERPLRSLLVGLTPQAEYRLEPETGSAETRISDTAGAILLAPAPAGALRIERLP
jgi:hypothetical protein